jgi:nitroreductase
MELYDVMTSAGATRRFKRDDVPDELIEKVLDKARFAPSGGNRQGWRVIVVKDGALRQSIRDLYQEPWRAYADARRANLTSTRAQRIFEEANYMAENLHEVPVHLVVCVELSALSFTDAALDRPSIVGGGSVYTFVQNILLACRNEGLGAALTTLLCVNEPQARELLSIPDEFAIAALIPVGYPERPLPTQLSRRPVQEIATVDGFAGAPLSR